LSTAIIYLNTTLVGESLGFMFIEAYETIKFKAKKAAAGKVRQGSKEGGNSVIQLVDEEENQEQEQGGQSPTTLATSPGRGDVHRDRLNCQSINLTQQINNTSISVINMESSLALETNYNLDNSLVSMGNMQGDQSILPVVVVRSPPRIRRLQPQRKIKSVPKKNIRIGR